MGKKIRREEEKESKVKNQKKMGKRDAGNMKRVGGWGVGFTRKKKGIGGWGRRASQVRISLGLVVVRWIS